MRRPVAALEPKSRRYTSAVTGDGGILPIRESIGRRLVREIDPLSREGKRLLRRGRVTLRSPDGALIHPRGIEEVLDRLIDVTRRRRNAYPQFDSWIRHHDRMLENIHRMKRLLKSGP